ncbi:MAG: iron-containing redox enzyme family protein [Proteobacteria bacterium]|nr:iron-containing redox enzyme family protein [Pseudomonadota bacterium]
MPLNQPITVENAKSASNLHNHVYDLVYRDTKSNTADPTGGQFLEEIEDLGRRAFIEKDEDALLAAHRTLYVINLAYLSVPWQLSATNVTHPTVARIKYTLEKYWEEAERKKHSALLTGLPDVDNFRDWVTKYVQDHPSNVIHPIFEFLRDRATFEQMREFFLQETPLEVLFGDIIALMMPGVYGSIKVELVKNFWDEVGHARDERVHRNLRFRMMDFLQIPSDIYIKDFELLICEELALINMYLSLATNRAKLTQLVGALLTTELMIPGRFEYQIEGWKRFGVDDETMVYLTEHTTVDVEHAEDWLDSVVMPILRDDPATMQDIVLGMARRLERAGAVCDRLYTHLQATEQASIGCYEGPFHGQ